MKRFLYLLAATAAITAGCNKGISPVAPTAAEGPELKDYAFPNEKGVALNGDNARITFVGTKPGGKHEGGFKSVSGDLKLLSFGPGQTVPVDDRTIVRRINVEIDADSLWADDEKLAQHLKSDDFFQAKAHPKITFKSTKIVPVEGKGPEQMTVTGDLTLRGTTKSITFPLKAKNTSGTGLFITGEFKINRKDFGMTFTPPKGSIDDDVAVSVKIGHEPEAPKG